MLPPSQRAKYFCVPCEQSLAEVELANSLVSKIVNGGTKQSVRADYCQTDRRKANAFNLAADFYSAAMNAIRDLIQHQNSSITKLWPNIKYFTFKQCHSICDILNNNIFSRNDSILRIFYPPWHFGCQGWVKSEKEKPSNDFKLKMSSSRLGYFCNPIDIAVAQNLIPDFNGLNQIIHNSKAIDISFVGKQQ